MHLPSAARERPHGFSEPTREQSLARLAHLAYRDSPLEGVPGSEIDLLATEIFATYIELYKDSQQDSKQNAEMQTEKMWLERDNAELQEENKWLQERDEWLVQESKRLEHEATHDPLTGIYNRRGFFKSSEAVLENLLPGQAIMTCIVDLDDFKNLNDTYGHAAGDAILQRVTKRLGQVAGNALMGRLGGDEFALLVIMKYLVADAALYEQAHKTVSRLKDSVVTGNDPINISIGGSSVWTAEELQDLGERPSIIMDKLLREADSAMYEDKDRHAKIRRPKES